MTIDKKSVFVGIFAIVFIWLVVTVINFKAQVTTIVSQFNSLSQGDQIYQKIVSQINSSQKQAAPTGTAPASK